MDELEISGKRYISTRRAGKEYKYHSDYIGQLIRGKKLLGRKIGRSWYVELESLTQYFGKGSEATIPPAPVIAKAVEERSAPLPKPAVKEKPIVVESVVEEEKEVLPEVEVAAPTTELAEKVEIKIEKPLEVKENTRDSFHIPVRIARPSFETPMARRAPTLTYVSDDTPSLPISKLSSQAVLSAVSVMPQSEEEAEEIIEEQENSKVEENGHREFKNKKSFIPVLGVFALGAIVLLVVVGGSILVSSHTIIEAGKAASVGYSL